MIRVLIILFAAFIMLLAGRVVFSRPEHKAYQIACYILGAFLSCLFFYIMVLSLFLEESI